MIDDIAGYTFYVMPELLLSPTAVGHCNFGWIPVKVNPGAEGPDGQPCFRAATVALKKKLGEHGDVHLELRQLVFDREVWDMRKVADIVLSLQPQLQLRASALLRISSQS